MTKFVFDSWAWIEYFEASLKGEQVRKLIDSPNNEIYSSTVSIAEIISKTIREGKDSKVALQAVNSLSKVVHVDVEIANEAGEIHASFKKKISDFGLADAFVIATAKKVNARIVTGDPHFKQVKGVLLL